MSVCPWSLVFGAGTHAPLALAASMGRRLTVVDLFTDAVAASIQLPAPAWSCAWGGWDAAAAAAAGAGAGAATGAGAGAGAGAAAAGAGAGADGSEAGSGVAGGAAAGVEQDATAPADKRQKVSAPSSGRSDPASDPNLVSVGLATGEVLMYDLRRTDTSVGRIRPAAGNPKPPVHSVWWGSTWAHRTLYRHILYHQNVYRHILYRQLVPPHIVPPHCVPLDSVIVPVHA